MKPKTNICGVWPTKKLKLMFFIKEIIKKLNEGKKSIEFIETKFKSLDNFLDGGFMRKELVIIGAFTGLGKSYIAGQIALAAAEQEFKTAYFSLEISASMVVARLLGAIAKIKPMRLMFGSITEEENKRKIEAEAYLEILEDRLHIYDDVYELLKIEEYIKANKYDFVVIDFIQNVFARGNDEYSKLSFVALQLQKIAKENNCCILILSQLSNAVAKDKNQTIPEYKGSGSIATVCDLGFYMSRDEVLEKDGVSNLIYLKLIKNRRGMAKIDPPFYLEFNREGGFIYEKN